jgi:regulator of sirC expression with transglutaminase-like and TPR domain
MDDVLPSPPFYDSPLKLLNSFFTTQRIYVGSEHDIRSTPALPVASVGDKRLSPLSLGEAMNPFDR